MQFNVNLLHSYKLPPSDYFMVLSFAHAVIYRCYKEIRVLEFDSVPGKHIVRHAQNFNVQFCISGNTVSLSCFPFIFYGIGIENKFQCK